MKHLVLLMLCWGLWAGPAMAKKEGNGRETTEKDAAKYRMGTAYVKLATELYQQLQLAGRGLEKEVFFKAYKGYMVLLNRGLVTNPHFLSIADFSQSNQNKRLYVIDLLNKEVFIQTYVSHGKNSGEEMATSFSNVNNSNKSVLGFLLTGQTYKGHYGLALKFQGMEPGINHLVTQRAIVVHGSKFVNEQELARRGQMVNSLGCPAVPMAQSSAIIHAIKGGSVYFIHHPSEHYSRQSGILNSDLGMILPLALQLPSNGSDTVPPPPAVTGLQPPI